MVVLARELALKDECTTSHVNHTFKLEEVLFDFRASDICSDCPVRSDYPMAWDDHRDGIMLTSSSNGSRGSRMTNRFCDCLVTHRFTIGYGLEILPHFHLKWSACKLHGEGKGLK